MTTLRAEAPAKINLDLRVLAREEGGYHQIETIFLLVDLCDVVMVSKSAGGISLDVIGAELGPPETNLAYRAAERFFHAAGIEAGVDIQLDKRIPAGAGLGGGSSDAATTLRLLNALFADPLTLVELQGIASDLGADVPFFLTEGGFALGWGRGGRILEAPAAELRHVVLALPGIHISTPEAYAALSESGLTPQRSRVIPRDTLADWDRLGSEGGNDFESVAFPAHPVLPRIQAVLMKEGADFARMSGSGSALFGIFRGEEQAKGAAETIRNEFDCDCVTVITRTRWADIVTGEG